MALKKHKNGQYIKIDLQGNFIIYNNEEDRILEKECTPFTDIKLKYDTIIKNFKQDFERRYYDPDFPELIALWELERDRYIRSHNQGLKSKNFPLISQYIPDVEKSLPEIECWGQLGVKGNTIKEVYEYIKATNSFGEVEDC